MQITALLSMLLLAGPAAALGINCRGSTSCNGMSSAISRDLAGAITSGINDNTWYAGGANIACHGVGSGVCAFLQNTNGANGKTIKALANAIIAHGCKVCGSAPFANNDINTGQLTFNFVKDPYCLNRVIAQGKYLC